MTKTLRTYVRMSRLRSNARHYGPWHIMEDREFTKCNIRAYRSIGIDVLQAMFSPEGKACKECAQRAAKDGTND